MNCNKCKAELPEEACYCLKCGEKVDMFYLKLNKFKVALNKIIKEYLQLDKRLKKKGIKDNIKIKILERQKKLFIMEEYIFREIFEMLSFETSDMQKKINKSLNEVSS